MSALPSPRVRTKTVPHNNHDSSVCVFLIWRQMLVEEPTMSASALSLRPLPSAHHQLCYTGEMVTNRLPKLSLITLLSPPGTAGYSGPNRIYRRVDVAPIRGSNFWGPRESKFQLPTWGSSTFLLKNVIIIMDVGEI